MAFTNTGKALDPASLGAAVVVNGGLIALLLLLGVVATGKPDDFTTIVTLQNPAPIFKEQPKPVERKAKPTPTEITPKRPADARAPAPDKTLTAETTITDDFPTGGGGDGTAIGTGPVIELPKLPTAPVMVSAKRDSRFARAFQPDYPPAMIRESVEGSVSVRVLIGTDGRVKSVEIISATRDAFAEATRRQALRAWRFVPATEDGRLVESWQTLSVKFQLPE